jgi:beta-glucanase (GH16 family)
MKLHLFFLIILLTALLCGCANAAIAPTLTGTAEDPATVLPTATETAAPTQTPTRTQTPWPTFPPTWTPRPTLSPTISPTPGAPRAGMQLIFEDDFNASELDAAKWMPCYPWENGGCTNDGNHEMEWYLPGNVDLADGLLRLRADKQEVTAPDGRTFPYTSGMVSSFKRFDFTYGYIEMRAKMPAGKGMWPAFWLLPSTEEWPPEIDILEVLGHQTNVVYTTLHYKLEGQPHLSIGSSYESEDFAADFHIFAADWRPGEITWFVDGNPVYRVTNNIPAQPMYILANLAVGGDWPGAPDEETVFPGYYEIDWIRVFRNPNLPLTPQP